MAANCRKPSPSCWRKEIADSRSPLSGYQMSGAARSSEEYTSPSTALQGCCSGQRGPQDSGSVWASPSNCDVISSWGWGSERGVLCLGDDSAGGGSVLEDGLLESFSPRQHYCRFQDKPPFEERRCFLTCFTLLSFPLFSHPLVVGWGDRWAGRGFGFLLSVCFMILIGPLTFQGSVSNVI